LGRVRTLVAVVVALPWVAWAILRTLGVELSYPLVALIAFTPYAALTSPVPVVTALVLKQRIVAVVAAVAAVALVFAMVPRALAGPQPEAAGPRITVMTSNLWLGQADPREVLRVAREHDVDVLSVQELRQRQMRRFETDDFPHRILEPERGAGGGGLLSRLAIEPTGTPMEGVIDLDGAPPITIRSVHPRPPVNEAAVPEWRAAIEALPNGDGRILAGDFNATLDHSEFRALLDRGYIDAADAAGAGLKPTWPAPPRQRRALPLTIDHILVDRRVRVERVTVVQIPRTDHRAVIAVLRLPSGR
jgi:endonuclease/exonuclease/phosphatase family metal-dependent hydrolase